MPTTPAPPLSRRAHLRAAALLLAIGIHTIFAAPLPRAVKPGDLERPSGVEEIDRWLALFAVVGLHPQREAFETWVLDTSKWWGDIHLTLKKPFIPFMRLTGTGQGWALFAAPETHPHRLEVHVKLGDAWVLAYRRFHPEANLRDAALRFRRVRGVYDGSVTRRHAAYERFADWLGHEALNAYPDASAARIQMVRLHTTPPNQPRDTREEPRRRITIERRRSQQPAPETAP